MRPRHVLLTFHSNAFFSCCIHFWSKKPSKNLSKTRFKRWQNRCQKRVVSQHRFFAFGIPFWRVLGLQFGAKLGQVGPKIAILASFGCSWAPLGRIPVSMKSQNGSQGTPRRLQEWIFGRFWVDFNAYIAYIYQQKSRYERHLTSTCVLPEWRHD